MKKLFSVILMVTCIFLLAGCGKQKVEAPYTPAPSIVINNQHFYAPNMPINELPEGYEYIGILSEDAANGTGLEGCKMYAIIEKDSFRDFYLYQECGTPIGNNIVDATKQQWAYVHWSLREN